MGTVEELKTVGSSVVRRLRKQKLDNGRPFLIWSDKLPKNQSYLEYPDHSIKVVTVSQDLNSFTVVRELTKTQEKAVRIEFNLF
ncbi:hypothetical protein GCM10023231_37830 [Olivibacter ginsenosidimutans]|uniref:Uncharacterized protein n=1 Tax=Olivibacter ginsenosidimutans TaxID=1176537 RepID=A0ABP9C8G2_9SPHI